MAPASSQAQGSRSQLRIRLSFPIPGVEPWGCPMANRPGNGAVTPAAEPQGEADAEPVTLQVLTQTHLKKKKRISKLGVVVYTFNPSTPEQKQVNPSEFKTSLIVASQERVFLYSLCRPG